MYADIFNCQRTLTYDVVRRKRLKLDQSSLAKRMGVSRHWLIEVEHGHPRAELGLVLRAVDALGIHLDVGSEPAKTRGSTKSAIDINAILAKAKKSKT